MSNVNAKLNGQAAQMPQSTSASGSPAQSPSVPISLYREIASELQSTQNTLRSLKTQNQELTQRNQQLRLEIERVVQSALHLRQVAEPSWGNVPQGNSELPFTSAGLNVGDRVETSVIPPAPMVEPTFTEQAATPVQPKSEPTAEISTWWLILIICMIVITAFGTGFLIVRPLLPSR